MIEALLIFTGILFAGAAGYHFKSLTASGAFAAVLVGIAVYTGFEEKGLFLLGAFFASSSYWSKYKSSTKSSLEEKLAKGARRDWRQVAANGGAAALFSVIFYFYHESIWLMGFVVSLASANSDTWASEIGSLSRKDPIYIRTFKRIERGTSGAVSLLGSGAALGGAFFIAMISLWLFQLDFLFAFFVFLFGFTGNVIDTLIGAFYQQVYLCKHCGIETEKKSHCHLPTSRIKGMSFVDNDMVNFLSGFIAAMAGMAVIYFVY